MIARFLIGGELLLVAAIVTGLLVLEGFRRLSRCCMSARTVIAAVARVDEPQPQQHIEDMPGHPETVQELADPAEDDTYWDSVEDLLAEEEIVAVVLGHRWVQ